VYPGYNHDQNLLLARSLNSDFALLSSLLNDTKRLGRPSERFIEGEDSIMNQAELIAAVAERADLSKVDAGKAVEALVGTITEALRQGDEVRISGFGTFGVSERGERQGRNPQTGEAITIGASKSAKFTAGKAVKDALNGGPGKDDDRG
jgi:DNA-binding protein HU-beta